MDAEDGDIESIASSNSSEGGVVLTVDERKQIRRQFEGNDPELTTLTIGYETSRYVFRGKYYFPPDGNWERDGITIGRNTQITQLNIESDIFRCANRDEFEAFCHGISENQSIQSLRISCCGLYEGEIFTILTPFFMKNINLRCLSLCGRFDDMISLGADVSHIVQSCALGLSKFDTLTEFTMVTNWIPDNDMRRILEALLGHTKMSKISMQYNIIERGAMSAMASLLERSHCFSSLSLSCINSIGDIEADVLAASLAKSTTLKKIGLGSMSNITVSGWRSILTRLQRSQLSALELDMFRNSVDDTIANLLANALTSGIVKGINLGESNYLTSTGWRAIFGSLNYPSCKLERLEITYNDFTDEDMASLGESLANNCVVRSIDLSSNNNTSIEDHTITSAGWGSLSSVLRNPNSAMEKIDLRFNNINDDVINSFARSLVGNNKMKELYLSPIPIEDESISLVNNWKPLSDVLCNEASIDATFDSNHTLERIIFEYPHRDDEPYEIPDYLRTLLQLNRGQSDAFLIARRKIIKVHFSGADFSMQPFIDMDLEVMPHVVSWMARDEFGHSLLYQFVRSTTLFVDVGGMKQPGDRKAGPKRQEIA